MLGKGVLHSMSGTFSRVLNRTHFKCEKCGEIGAMQNFMVLDLSKASQLINNSKIDVLEYLFEKNLEKVCNGCAESIEFGRWFDRASKMAVRN